MPPPTTPTIPPEVPGDCPSGGADWQSYGAYCYAFKVAFHMSWEDAQEECVKHGGPMTSLASIQNSAENLFVWQNVHEIAATEPLTTAVWIGLKRDRYGK